MKKWIHTSALIIATALLSSCVMERPISKTRADNNRSYRVEYLFEHDGCKVYRFEDNNNYVYFTNCGGDVTSVVNDSVQIQTLSKTGMGIPDSR